MLFRKFRHQDVFFNKKNNNTYCRDYQDVRDAGSDVFGHILS